MRAAVPGSHDEGRRSGVSDVTTGSDVDVGSYCRQVEDYLTQVNSGHLIRVVGPAFELVRGWARAGVPISIVFEGIRLKAERHHAGRSKRPLRLEFCAADVDQLFDRWRRAIGLSAAAAAMDTGSPAEAAPRRRPSLAKHVNRAIERLTRSASRADVSEAYRDAVNQMLDRLIDVRDRWSGARGADRTEAAGRLLDLDRALLDAVRGTLDGPALEALRAEAMADVSAFRSRLTAEAWERTLAVGLDRHIRERFGLPVLELDA
jgi:hypothetical protein